MSDERHLSEGARLGRQLGELMQRHLEDPTIDPRATRIAREFRTAFRQMVADFGTDWEQLLADPEFRRVYDEVIRDVAEKDVP